MGLLGVPAASNITSHRGLHHAPGRHSITCRDAPSQLPADTGHGIISPALELRQLHEDPLSVSQGSGSTWVPGGSMLECFILGVFLVCFGFCLFDWFFDCLVFFNGSENC